MSRPAEEGAAPGAPPDLRAATVADLDALCARMAENYAEAGYPYDPVRARAAFDALVRDPALGRVWVFESEGLVAGYAALAFGWSLEYGGRDAFVDDLYLVPGLRGRGLGGRALEVVEAAARELGVRMLHLEVERENENAAALYRRLGYRDNERQLLSKRL